MISKNYKLNPPGKKSKKLENSLHGKKKWGLLLQSELIKHSRFARHIITHLQ